MFKKAKAKEKENLSYTKGQKPLLLNQLTVLQNYETKGGQKMKNGTFKKLKAISAAICITSSIISYLAAIVLLAIVAPWSLFLTIPVTFLFATLIFSIFAD